MNLYKEYLEMPLALDFSHMVALHEEMIQEVGDDEDAKELYEELVEQATKYAEFRSNWYIWKREERIERDASRSITHDSLIVKFNMLARYLKMHEKKAEWRRVLGDEKLNPNTRKRIGDFACYIVFVNSICSR